MRGLPQLRTIRVADAGAVYAHPAAQLARLERIGLLHKVAVGPYVVVPQDRIGVGSNDLSLCAIT
ncbi:MAG TPA: hypothetical protein VIM17_12815, partial [Jatrophihabitantaceae bacterium]